MRTRKNFSRRYKNKIEKLNNTGEVHRSSFIVYCYEITYFTVHLIGATVFISDQKVARCFYTAERKSDIAGMVTVGRKEKTEKRRGRIT